MLLDFLYFLHYTTNKYEMQGIFWMNGNGCAAIICEYNPFHRGHMHQISEAKKHFSTVVCVMSGDCVQRGDCAVAGKYLRARAAVESGADLVVELPAPWSASSASDFARAGVRIALALEPDALCFSAESDPELLLSVAALAGDPSFVSSVGRLASHRDSKLSFPAAFSGSVGNALGGEAAEAMKKPNNILAVEYLKNLAGTSVAPFILRRDPSFSPSSEIRALAGEEFLNALPDASRAVFASALGEDLPRSLSRLDPAFAVLLRSGADFSDVYSMTPDLASKLVSAARELVSFEEICRACVDKKYTLARVRRALLCALLGVKKSDAASDPLFTTVLAAGKAGCDRLASLRKSEKDVRILTKPVASRLTGAARAQFELSKRISDIHALTAPAPQSAARAMTPYIRPGGTL